MSLDPGTRIGSYEITGEIGAGGMGVVYRATDTTLERDVAIKTLPEALAADADRLARFEREAKLLAALNHPNIAIIYGLEESDGTRCIAMELIEGQTLEERLKDGSLRVDEAMRLALQIAQALEAAHEKGVVHRDLKPANVMITRDGLVKVLDFGLAKAFADDAEKGSLGQSPALSLAMTQAGLILGTASYMSPEQASGQATDQRADVWAFGVVLYEMLSGLPLFSGESVPHILADVLKTEPDWSRLPKKLHPRLKLLLERCLTKQPRNRYHSIADARIEIEAVLGDPGGAEAQSTAREAASPRSVLPWVAITAVGTAAIVGIIAWLLQPTPEPLPLTRFVYELPEGQSFRQTDWPFMAISPDGRHFVYDTQDGLYLRLMDDIEARLIPGTEPRLDSMVFSPDGQSVAYWSDGGLLRRIAISGGAPVTLSEIGDIYGMSWQPDGTILIGQPEGLVRVSANGGAAEVVIPSEAGVSGHFSDVLPDGDTAVGNITTAQDWDASQIFAISMSTGEETLLIEGGTDARYLPTGHLVYALGDTLFGVAFDADTLAVSGGAVPLVQGVMRSAGQTGAAHYSVSDNGTLVYVSGIAAAGTRTLLWVDRDGNEEPIDAPLRAYTSPRLSPDGTGVVVNARDEDIDIWIWDLVRETLLRMTFDPAQDRFPVWSPDGQRIAFHSQMEGGPGLFWRAADGTGPAELIAEGQQLFATSWLPDASGILFFGTSTTGNNDDIGIVHLGDDQNVMPLLATTFTEVMPDISPNGRWLAYASDESGRSEIYVRSYPDVDTGGRWQISTGGGTRPLWSRDGAELFYVSGGATTGDNALMSVPVEATDQTFIPGRPEVILEGDYASFEQGGRSYDVSPDGERFLMMKDAASAAGRSRIVVVENWFEEVQRLVPTE